ncbi:insulin-related peptide 2-like [Aricia agestis]|uniref:insulin-related peptide 2-like n=1 Tax=Aricia agestis TaxID=91739 RepID=UPI001C20ADC5|nr:insulin-related peptide 2-like [Aricia agestis]
MNSQQSLFLLTVCAVLSACCGHIGGMQPSQEVVPQTYCGRNLARALALFCMDVNPEKRGDEGGMYNSILSPYYKEQENQWPWMSHQKAHAMGLNRGKRFVVSECCDKPCSISELLSYC